MQLKGNKLAAVLGTDVIYQLFYLTAKMSQSIGFNLVFNEDSKMGVFHFCTFCILNVIVKKIKMQLFGGLVIII
jgi:hypothetical protein